MAASANADAIAHLTKGLELIDSLPQSSERISREIDFRLALGTPLIAIRGWDLLRRGPPTPEPRSCVRAPARPLSSFVALWGCGSII